MENIKRVARRTIFQESTTTTRPFYQHKSSNNPNPATSDRHICLLIPVLPRGISGGTGYGVKTKRSCRQNMEYKGGMGTPKEGKKRVKKLPKWETY